MVACWLATRIMQSMGVSSCQPFTHGQGLQPSGVAPLPGSHTSSAGVRHIGVRHSTRVNNLAVTFAWSMPLNTSVIPELILNCSHSPHLVAPVAPLVVVLAGHTSQAAEPALAANWSAGHTVQVAFTPPAEKRPALMSKYNREAQADGG